MPKMTPEEVRAALEEAVGLLYEQDRETFGVDPITGEAVDPWEADACYAWQMKARAFVVAALAPQGPTEAGKGNRHEIRRMGE